LAILPLVNNINPQTHQWDGASLASMLADPAARSKAVQSLLGYVQGNRLAGICIDFENVPPASQADLNSFMNELASAFHPLGLEVTLAVPFDDASYDAAQLAENCDYLIFMGYDQHWSTSEAGPIAAQDWFASGLRRRAAQVPPQKLVVALGNYGYDWIASSKSGTVLTFEDVIQLAQREIAAASLDPQSLNPTFTYTDSLQKAHTVWYLDAATVFNQLVAANAASTRGVAIWRLGSEDPSIWQVLASRAVLGQEAVQALSTLSFGDSFYYQGRGEILKISTEPVDGRREIQFDPARGLITAEAMTAYPSPYTLTRWGSANPKAIALTFDDGPSQPYTSQVLDILEQFKVPGTFFIIGANGDHNPELVKRIVSEGFEIGNHTYTHPDISAISTDQLRLELNATQLLFESRLGIQSILFRPPYGEDIEPQSVDEVRPLDLASQMGYYTIGMKIDPADWRRPGADKIVDATVQAVLSGAGNVILLHDGGGDRSQTVAALPQIIAQLQEHGYHFVAVSDLMGLTRAQVMPSLTKNQQVMTAVTGVGLQVIGGGQNLISVLFSAAILIGLFRMFAVNLLAVIQWLKTDPRTYPENYRPRVSVIVPAYNEAAVIQKTVQALLNSTYSNLTVIVVDDGSTDGTAERLEAHFPREPRLCVFTKPNGGKSSAINYGLVQTEAAVIVVLDADTQILPDAVGKLARHFEDPKVGAVAGNSK
ncbi:MAG TPA: polysaccharide deacetylase family protein, partial [Anaerolineaceae bacterium]